MGTRGRPDTRVATDSPFARYKHKKARQSHRRNAFNLKKDSSLSEGLLNQHESWTFAKYFIPQAATFAVNLAGSREEKKEKKPAAATTTTTPPEKPNPANFCLAVRGNYREERTAGCAAEGELMNLRPRSCRGQPAPSLPARRPPGNTPAAASRPWGEARRASARLCQVLFETAISLRVTPEGERFLWISELKG